tara:strand:- start:9391 stop:9867 length:477 start_codon:yes stop_codon:yes gene_type:complete
MADEPTKEELELMMRMILGNKYDPDFDPRTLGKSTDQMDPSARIAAGLNPNFKSEKAFPRPEWSRDSNITMTLGDVFGAVMTGKSPLRWAMIAEERRRKKEKANLEAGLTATGEVPDRPWVVKFSDGKTLTFSSKEKKDEFIKNYKNMQELVRNAAKQ